MRSVTVPGHVAAPPRRWADLPLDALTIVGVAWLAVGLLIYHPPLFSDAIDYWSVNAAAPYGTLGEVVNFAYSPPLVLAFAAIGHLPLELFLGLWAAMNLALAAWLIWPQPRLGLVLAMPLLDLFLTGQIELLMAFGIVLAMRRPAAWTLSLLAKPTSGVGALWFAFRGEWRAFLLATVPALAIAGLSYLVAPDLWAQWLAFLGRSAAQDSEYLPIRIALAVAVVAWGARTGRPWTVIVAATLALPVIYIHSLAMLAAIPRLRSRQTARVTRMKAGIAFPTPPAPTLTVPVPEETHARIE